MAAPRGRKFGFTQSYDRSYGGIVPVFIEFTDLYLFIYAILNERHQAEAWQIRRSVTDKCNLVRSSHVSFVQDCS